MGKLLVESYNDWFLDIKNQPIMFVIYFIFGVAVATGLFLFSYSMYRAYTNIEDFAVAMSWVGMICTAMFLSYFGKLIVTASAKHNEQQKKA